MEKGERRAPPRGCINSARPAESASIQEESASQNGEAEERQEWGSGPPARCQSPGPTLRTPHAIGTPLEHIAGALWTSVDFHGLAVPARPAHLQRKSQIRKVDALNS
jgi:hypothetical protein